MHELKTVLIKQAKEFRIDISVIEPGGIKTDWGSIAADKLADSAKGGAYEESALKTSEGIKTQYSSNMLFNPIVVTKAINSNKPKSLVFLHAILPTRLFDKIMKSES
ncbi:retinol dehydrogenase [Mammaliicoccus fleurettii]|nr:retinol dehydrogenase [Mammaliicoccus fleurettii]